ncbi:MAG: hypothetical protein ACYCSF_12215 [Acidimicrobiales bacterium]
MAMWRVRDFHDDHLDAVVRLWDDPGPRDTEPVFSLSELVAAVRSSEPAVVATVGDQVVGCAVAELDKDRVPNLDLDRDAIVTRSELLTPAEIEFAARRAAQLVFERSVAGGAEAMATTAEVLACIASTRPTLTSQMIEEFEAHIDEYARL